MPDGKRQAEAIRDLRELAEAEARRLTRGVASEPVPLTREAMERAMHELRVQQIELELQNEELRRAQIALDRTRARYFDLYDLAPVGYCTLDAGGRILEANLTAATLLGVPRSVLVRKPFTRFILAGDQDTWYLLRKRLQSTGEAQDCDLRLTGPDGGDFWAHLEVSAVTGEDGAEQLRIILADVSARHRVEQERVLHNQAIEAKNQELDLARVVAERANHAKSEFLSSMSHELRTPLNAILGFAQLLDSGNPEPTPGQKASIAQVLKAGWYLLDLVNEILDLAKIDAGKVALSIEPVALAVLLADCRTLVQNQAKKRGIQIRFPEFPAPRTVCADPTRLKQVLVNLLSNAIKFNKPGGSVRVECLDSAPGRLRIRVHDTGAGLTSEQMAQLFQPFNRLGQKDNVVEGTGVGLVVAKRLIELMDGEIGVESTVGQGSVFWVELLLASAPVASHVAVVQVPSPSPAAGPVRTVLYIEDNPANLALVQGIFETRTEFRLLSAGDALTGIALARQAQPDVILMDISLPGMDGMEALKILQQDPRTRLIPVVAVSAHAMPRDIKRAMDAGFFRYLAKPIRFAEFMEALEAARHL
jgi:PAS domain S-box-containing protein